jgi:hypothetical protein
MSATPTYQRGLHSLVVGRLAMPSCWRCCSTTLFFLCKIKQLLLKNEMYLSEKNIQYADLLMAFIKCPFDKADDDCPFEPYWKLSDIKKQLNTMQDLTIEELDRLQKHHRICLLNKVRRIREGE